jgi:hypothetical protein
VTMQGAAHDQSPRRFKNVLSHGPT